MAEVTTVDLRLGDCLEILPTLDGASVDLVVTSPPYFNLRAYAKWRTYYDYLDDVDHWFFQMSRVLKTGRHVCWNVQPYLPGKQNGERYHYALSADTTSIAQTNGFMLDTRIVWHKTNAVCQRMFGSYPYPPTMIYTPTTEDVLVFRKHGKADLGRKTDASKLTRDEWAAWTLPVWDMPIGQDKDHPATFPIELPRRCIRLHSFVGDTVLDMFSGMATTGLACYETGRNFIGIEKDAGYFAIAQKRIEQAQAQLTLPLFG